MKTCEICRSTFADFETYGIPPKKGRCPACGAKSRTRAIGHYLEKEVAPRLGAGSRMLEVGASKVGVHHLRAPRFIGGAVHTVIDIQEKEIHRHIFAPHEFRRMSVDAMSFADQSFDFLICNHALTFVPNLNGALGEIRRVLKVDGEAMLNNPLVAGPTISAEEHRELHPALGEDFYRENGTAWYFGEEDYERILAEVGFGLRRLHPFATLTTAEAETRGVKREETLFLARRR